MKQMIPPYLRVTKRALQSWATGEPELRLVPRLCSRNEYSIDVGANNGVYTWHLARWSAGVVAFEPQPSHARFLKRAFGRRVRVEQVALSKDSGEATLRVPLQDREDGRATIEPKNLLPQFSCGEYKVLCRRLDTYEIGPVGLIKIDVEGHELAVLEGAEAILRRDLPNLIIEAEERHRPGALESVHSFLGALGYLAYCCRDRELRDLDVSLSSVGCGGDHDAPGQSVNNYIFIARHGVATVLRSSSWHPK